MYIYFCNVTANFALRSAPVDLGPSLRVEDVRPYRTWERKDTVGGWIIRKPTKPRTSLTRKVFWQGRRSQFCAFLQQAVRDTQIAPPEIVYRSRSIASAGIVYRSPFSSHDPIGSIQLHRILLKESKPRVAEGACRTSAGLVDCLGWVHIIMSLLRGQQQLRSTFSPSFGGGGKGRRPTNNPAQPASSSLSGPERLGRGVRKRTLGGARWDQSGG